MSNRTAASANMKFIIHIIIVIFAIECSSSYNTEDYFPSVKCQLNECIMTSIETAGELSEVFNRTNQEEFAYYSCRENYWNCNLKTLRNDLTTYQKLVFEKSNFEKFPSGPFHKFGEIKILEAENVSLSELNRDDLKSFRNLEQLLLSNNKIRKIGSVTFVHLELLEFLDVSYNQIEFVHENAFEECSKYLKEIKFSHNKLKDLSENVLEIIGNNIDSKIFFDFNNIEKLNSSTTHSASKRQFHTVSLTNNKLKSFNYNCSKISNLLLNSNELNFFDAGNCQFDSLELYENAIVTAKISKVTQLNISNNPKLSNLTIDWSSLKKLDISDIPASVLTFNDIAKCEQLEFLNVKNTYVGPLNINTLSELTSLEILILRNSGLSHIDFGMFSHQLEVKYFDISYNNLKTIDLKMLTSMKKLDSLDISGNNLTVLEHFEEIKNFFPKLTEIGIDENTWNCSYLALLYNKLEESVSVKLPSKIVKNSPNVMGMGCVASQQANIKLLDTDKANESLVQKMNEIIQDMNVEKTKASNTRYDNDIIRSELLHIRKEILDLKSENVKNKLLVNSTNRTPVQALDLNIVSNMMEQLNNFILEKQKLANDQLQLKIDQLQLQLSNKEVLNKKTFNDVNYDYVKSNDKHDSKGIEIILAVILTSLLIITVAFGYQKAKNLVGRQTTTRQVLARSTNTLNTTVELPFD